MRISDWSSDVCSSDLLGAFDNRLSFEAVYYHKDTKGIIVTVPASLGVKAGLSNPGEVSNKGIELATSWTQSFNDDMSLTIGGNLTTMDNKEIGRASCRERVCQYV